MKVNFHIKRLVIEGASQAEGLRLADALRGHLSELPTAAAMAARPTRISRLDAGLLSHRSSTEQIGRHIAGQIFANLKGPRHG